MRLAGSTTSRSLESHVKTYRDITDPAVAKALAHPLRTRILAALEERTASPSELADELDAPLGVLSYHVRRLTALGFLKLVKRVPRRGAVEHYYTAVRRPRLPDTAWGSAPAIVRHTAVSAALDQVGSDVGAAAADGGFDAPEAQLTRSPLRVDEQGWRALAQELEAMSDRIAEIQAQSEKRLGRADPDGQRSASVVLMLFESATEARLISGDHAR